MSDAPLDTSRPFLHEVGLAAGLTAAELRGRRFRTLLRGVHVAADAPVDAWVSGRAALLLAPRGTVLARHTAARLWGAVVPDHWRTHVTTLWPTAAERAEAVDERRRARGGGAGCTAVARRRLEWGRMDVDGVDSRVSCDHAGVTTLRGLPVTDPVRTFLDLAEDLDLVDLVVAGDSLVRAGRVTPAQLLEGARRPGRHRRLARRAAALVRSGVASAPESRLRMLVVLAGLPEPEVDVEVRDEDGTLLRALDLGWRRVRVGLEYDGRHHAENPAQWAADLGRREELDGWGWRLVVVIGPGLYADAERTLRRVVDVLRSRGMDVRVTSEEWRRYFARRP